MAQKTLVAHGFPEGTLVAAYPRENLVNGSPSGTAVDTSTVTAGSLTFDGLTEGRRYVAYAAGRGTSFFMEPGSVDLLRPIDGAEAQILRLAGVFDPDWGTEQALNDRALERVSAFDNFTAAEQANVSLYVGSIDVTAKLQAINDYLATLTAGGVIVCPPGKYKVNGLVLSAKVSIVAEGYRGGVGAVLGPVQFVTTAAGWSIDTPAGTSTLIRVLGISFLGAGAGTSIGGVRFRDVRYGAVRGCSFDQFAEWAILWEAGVACVFDENYAQNCLLDRTRSIDKTTLPHGVIELRGSDYWVSKGEYTASLGVLFPNAVFGAAVVTGTAQVSAAGTLVLAAGESGVDDFYNGYMVEITAGTAVGEINYLTDYVGATKTATVFRNWVATPDATSVYKLTPLRCFAAAFKGNVSWVRDVMCETSEAGVWVSSLSNSHLMTGVKADLNSGPGWVLAGSANLQNCNGSRNSQAADGVYDDFVLLKELPGALTACVAGGLAADTAQPRHGFNSTEVAHGVGTADRWHIQAPSRQGSRRGSLINIVNEFGASADLPSGELVVTAGPTASLDKYKAVRFGVGVPTTFTGFTGLVNGVIYTFSANNNSVTLQHGANIVMKAAANLAMTTNTPYQFYARKGVLYQL